jgi:integrase
VRFHDLRHICATLLFSQGVHPKYVQELLGHANINITLDRYSYIIPGMSDHTARAGLVLPVPLVLMVPYEVRSQPSVLLESYFD